MIVCYTESTQTRKVYCYVQTNDFDAVGPASACFLRKSAGGGRRCSQFIRCNYYHVLGDYACGDNAISEPNPPGSLIDPDSIPKADQSDVGKTVELSIGDKIFDYFYDSQSGKERLLVLESVDFYQNLGKITIYETKLGGMDGLIAALKKPFNAKILAISNISWEEVNYAHTAKEYLEDSIPIGRFSAEELIDLSAPVKNPRADQWYCSVQSLDSSDVMGLLSNLTDAPSKVLQTRMNRIDSILTRFDLKKYL